MIGRMLGLLGCFMLAACSESSHTRDSEQVGNLNIRAELQVESSGLGTVEVSARLLEYGAPETTYLRLSGNDKLYASNGTSYDQAVQPSGGLFGHLAQVGAEVALMRERSRVEWDLLFIRETSEPEYFTRFQAGDVNLPYYVTFQRTTDHSVHDAEIRLPPAFELLSPQPGVSVSMADPIDIQWTQPNPAYTVTLELAARCASGDYTFSKDLGADSGSTQLSAVEAYGSSPTGPCTVAVGVRKVWSGAVPTVFGGGGTATGIQRRTVSISAVSP